MISHKLKLIFIHIKKTAGNSINIFLKDYSANSIVNCSRGQSQQLNVYCEFNKDIKHSKLDYYKKIYSNKIKDYTIFTIVRNPYDRALSFYYYITNNKTYNKDLFIKTLSLLDHQIDYISNEMILVHYENLITELKEISCLKHIDFNKFPHENKSINSKKKTSVLDQETKDLIYNKFKIDFIKLGYKQ